MFRDMFKETSVEDLIDTLKGLSELDDENQVSTEELINILKSKDKAALPKKEKQLSQFVKLLIKKDEVALAEKYKYLITQALKEDPALEKYCVTDAIEDQTLSTPMAKVFLRITPKNNRFTHFLLMIQSDDIEAAIELEKNYTFDALLRAPQFPPFCFNYIKSPAMAEIMRRVIHKGSIPINSLDMIEMLIRLDDAVYAKKFLLTIKYALDNNQDFRKKCFLKIKSPAMAKLFREVYPQINEVESTLLAVAANDVEFAKQNIEFIRIALADDRTLELRNLCFQIVKSPEMVNLLAEAGAMLNPREIGGEDHSALTEYVKYSSAKNPPKIEVMKAMLSCGVNILHASNCGTALTHAERHQKNNPDSEEWKNALKFLREHFELAQKTEKDAKAQDAGDRKGLPPSMSNQRRKGFNPVDFVSSIVVENMSGDVLANLCNLPEKTKAGLKAEQANATIPPVLYLATGQNSISVLTDEHQTFICVLTPTHGKQNFAEDLQEFAQSSSDEEKQHAIVWANNFADLLNEYRAKEFFAKRSNDNYVVHIFPYCWAKEEKDILSGNIPLLFKRLQTILQNSGYPLKATLINSIKIELPKRIDMPGKLTQETHQKIQQGEAKKRVEDFEASVKTERANSKVKLVPHLRQINVCGKIVNFWSDTKPTSEAAALSRALSTNRSKFN